MLSRTKRLLGENSGLATIEFALAGTALTVGLLNGLEVARWSLQKMEMANAVQLGDACDLECLRHQASAGEDQLLRRPHVCDHDRASDTSLALR